VFATPTTAIIIDQHDFTGDILTLIEEAEKYILKNIRIGMRLDGLVRVDVPEIAREAFREAIINAFCHRDYCDPDEVRIAVFPDRVEVRNPGTLMEGVTLRTLKTARVSRIPASTPSVPDLRLPIKTALAAFSKRPIREASFELFTELGYRSERTLDFGPVTQFCDNYDKSGLLASFNPAGTWKNISLAFQLTGEDIKKGSSNNFVSLILIPRT